MSRAFETLPQTLDTCPFENLEGVLPLASEALFLGQVSEGCRFEIGRESAALAHVAVVADD